MPGRANRGQVLPIFAIVLLALIAVTALVIDMGFLFGQRRYDQNGADAAVLAAARQLAVSVSPYDNNGNVFFGVSDADVYAEALKYVAPNQNANLGTRNSTAMTLEYWDGATLDAATGKPKWCHALLSLPPPRTDPVVDACTLDELKIGSAYVYVPPRPALGYPYQVRVTVSSTTEPFFAPAARIAGSTQTVTADPNAPACLKTGSSTDAHVTCAQAVAAVKGISTAVGLGPLVPVTTGDCDIAGDPSDDKGLLHPLWGSGKTDPSDTSDDHSDPSRRVCGYHVNPWKNMIDLTSRTAWCNDASSGSTLNPDYKYFSLLPTPHPDEPAGGFVRADCQFTDSSWDRDGFKPETGGGLPGGALTGQTDHDVPVLIARGFQGEIRADYPDGNMVPTYVDANPGQGSNLGQNVAAGFYCGSSGVYARSCDTTINPTGTYFFARNQPGMTFPCDDEYGKANPDVGHRIGCRDAAVPTWGDDNLDPANKGVDWAIPAGLSNGGSNWNNNGGGGPDRVRLVRILTMRIYCEESGNDPMTGEPMCSNPPNPIVGTSANSAVWGRFISPFYGSCPPGANCNGSPSVNGNVATLLR